MTNIKYPINVQMANSQFEIGNYEIYLILDIGYLHFKL